MPKLNQQEILKRKISKIQARMTRDEIYIQLLQKQLSEFGSAEVSRPRAFVPAFDIAAR